MKNIADVSVYVKNKSGGDINPATEDTVSQLVMAVTNAIDSTAYDLNAAAFSETTSITKDYILDNIELNFSTTEVKTITVTSADGTILWGGDLDVSASNLGYNTIKQNFFIPFGRGFNASENITVAVTQFSSAGTMDCILKIRSGTNSLLGDPSVFIKSKKFHITDPDFYKPRGNMFTYQSIDHNFGGTDTGTYPTGGENLAFGNGAAPSHGVYVAPKTNQIMYVAGIKIFFNHTAKNLFGESYKDRISDAASAIQVMHNGNSFCSCENPLCITFISDNAPMEIEAALGNGEFLYSQSLPLETPGRFDGDQGDSFGFRMSGGNGVYLGNSFAANKLTYLVFQFTGWVVEKINGEEVIQHEAV